MRFYDSHKSVTLSTVPPCIPLFIIYPPPDLSNSLIIRQIASSAEFIFAG